MTDRDAMSRRTMLLGGAALAGAALPSGQRAAAAGRAEAITVALPGNLETLDPHQFRSILTGSVLACAVETLLTRDVATMELKPSLATAWRNLDPLTWEFTLRQGVKFHNGEVFDARSVKFSIERIIDSPLNTLGKTVWPPSFGQSVEIVDPYTVRIHTRLPDPLVPNRLAAESLNMAPPKALAEMKDKYVSNSLIGTGPYKFAEYTIGRQVVMQANPDYWGEQPATPKVVWAIIADPATRVAALQRGTTDVVVNLTYALIAGVKQSAGLAVYSVLGSIIQGILLNANQTPALHDLRVRQALNYAIDRDAIINNLFLGLGKAANGVVASQVEYAIDPGSYGYHPDKARALLAQAGFKDGLELTLWQSNDRYDLGVEAAQAIAGFFEDVGVHTNLQLLDWGQFNARAGRTQFKDALHYGFVNGVWDPDYVMQRVLPSYPTFRYYDAPEALQKDLQRYSSTFDKAERAKIAAASQQTLHDQACWVFLYQTNENFGMKQGVQGFRMRPDHMIVVRDAYVEV